MKRIALLALVALPALAMAEPTTWNVDPAHTHASFTVRHLGITNVRGEFGKVDGSLVLDESDVTKSTVEATIDATALTTGVEKRDAHLKSPDFFDVATFPSLKFKSTKVEKAGEGMLKVTGDLTMHGVTKPVVLDVTGPTPPITAAGMLHRGVEATAKISRKEWGLKWNNMIEAVPAVGDEVKIELEVELVRPVPVHASN